MAGIHVLGARRPPRDADVTLSTTTSGKNCARMFGTAAKPATTISTSSRFAAVRWRVK
jgi:hypothetical protein